MKKNNKKCSKKKMLKKFKIMKEIIKKMQNNNNRNLKKSLNLRNISIKIINKFQELLVVNIKRSTFFKQKDQKTPNGIFLYKELQDLIIESMYIILP